MHSTSIVGVCSSSEVSRMKGREAERGDILQTFCKILIYSIINLISVSRCTCILQLIKAELIGS